MMNLKGFLTQNKLILNMPYAVADLIAEREYYLLKSVLEEWCENASLEYFLMPISEVFSLYIQKSEEMPLLLKSVMKDWWRRGGYWRKNNGESINKEIFDFFMSQKGDVAIKEIPKFNEEQFEGLFDGEVLSKPVLDFYNFFNPANKTFIRYENMWRAKWIPLAGSKKSIVKKYEKNEYLIITYLRRVLRNHCEGYLVDGKSWTDYLVELVISKLVDEKANQTKEKKGGENVGTDKR